MNTGARRRYAENLSCLLNAAVIGDVDYDGEYTVTVRDIRCDITDDGVVLSFPDPYADPDSHDPVTVQIGSCGLFTAVATMVHGLVTVLYPSDRSTMDSSGSVVDIGPCCCGTLMAQQDAEVLRFVEGPPQVTRVYCCSECDSVLRIQVTDPTEAEHVAQWWWLP